MAENKSKNNYLVIYFDGIGVVDYKLPNPDRNGITHEAATPLQLGYAITIHKSQGTTIPITIISLPHNEKINNRELLYTAITRAKEHCYFLSSVATIQAAVVKTGARTHHSSVDLLLNLNLEYYLDFDEALTGPEIAAQLAQCQA